MSPEELTWLAQQAQQAMRICEIGSWKGRTTRALAEHTPGVVSVVDHWRGSTVGADETTREVDQRGATALYREFAVNVSDLVLQGKVEVWRMSSAEAAIQLSGEPFDLVFIDASHDYASVRHDLLAYRQLLRRGGLLCGDDIGFPGVQRALAECVPDATNPVGKLWMTCV